MAAELKLDWRVFQSCSPSTKDFTALTRAHGGLGAGDALPSGSRDSNGFRSAQGGVGASPPPPRGGVAREGSQTAKSNSSSWQRWRFVPRAVSCRWSKSLRCEANL